MADCLFCKIVAGEVPGERVYEDDRVVAFKDIHPVAPNHVLIVPRKHIVNCNDLAPADEALAGHLLAAAAKIARELGVDERGYRLVINNNAEAGQVVFHLHLHLLAGRPMHGLG
jgi:histidine triad (HIT) family protein